MNTRLRIWEFIRKREFEGRESVREKGVIVLTLANREPSSTAAGVEGDGGSTRREYPRRGCSICVRHAHAQGGVEDSSDTMDRLESHHSSPELGKNHRIGTLEGI